MSRARSYTPKTTVDAFQKARRDILETIQRVPAGKVASYAQVAYAAGWPGRARLVARVLGDVPAEYEARHGELPWWRIINAAGQVAIPKSSPGHQEQIRRLKAEGLVFLNGRISHARQGWQPGDASPLLD